MTNALRKKAFTLIELLAVMAIVSILMAVLIPSLALAKDKTKIVLCAANLKSIHHAMATYAIDWKDRLPPKYELKKKALSAKDIAEGKRLNTPSDGIQRVLESYASARTFGCPGDIGCFEDRSPVVQRRGTSYDVKGVPPKDYQNLSKAVFWNKLSRREDIAGDVFKPWEAAEAKKVQEKIQKGEMGPVVWHKGIANIAMAQGHVISVKTKQQEQTAKGKNPSEDSKE